MLLCLKAMKRARHRVPDIDTLEKAHEVIEALMEQKAADRLVALFRIFPEMARWTHREIAENSGLTRETVSRVMKRMFPGEDRLPEKAGYSRGRSAGRLQPQADYATL